MTSSSAPISTTSPTTTSTTTSSTTPSTTTPLVVRLVPHITEFRLTSVTYESRSSQIMVNYLIRTNVSSSYGSSSFQVVPTHVTIEIECRSSESDQQWTRVVHNQTLVTHYVSSSTSMLPRSEPRPGSFVRCSAQVFDSLDRSRVSPNSASAAANLLIEPAAVSNLFMKRLNETSIELVWVSPVYFYDYIDMMCHLDEYHVRFDYGPAVRKFGERLFPKQTALNVASRNLNMISMTSSNRHTLNNLIPGGVYNCTLVTVRSVLNFTTRSRGETAYQMTGNFYYLFDS